MKSSSKTPNPAPARSNANHSPVQITAEKEREMMLELEALQRIIRRLQARSPLWRRQLPARQRPQEKPLEAAFRSWLEARGGADAERPWKNYLHERKKVLARCRQQRLTAGALLKFETALSEAGRELERLRRAGLPSAEVLEWEAQCGMEVAAFGPWRKRLRHWRAKASVLEGRLIQAHTGFAAKSAQKWAKDGSGEKEDLCQEALLAMVEALEKFDARKSRFCTFAGKFIDRRLKRYVEDHRYTIRIPNYMHTSLNKMRRVTEQLSKQRGGEPEITEIAEAMGVSSTEVLKLQQTVALMSVDSLNLIEEEGRTPNHSLWSSDDAA